LKTFFFILAPVFLILFAFEFFIRTTAPQILMPPLIYRNQGLTRVNPRLSARMQAMGSYDYSLQTNSEGFRGVTEYSQKASSKYRVLVMGDSIAFGVGAGDSETLPSSLQKLLGEDFEVINAGVPGTGTGEQLVFYKETLKAYHPDLVLLVSYSNDLGDDSFRPFFKIDSNGKLLELPRSKKEALLDRVQSIVFHLPLYQWISEHSHAARWFLRNFYFLLLSKESRDLSNPPLTQTSGTKESSLTPPAKSKINPKERTLFELEISKFYEEVKNSHALFWVLLFPNEESFSSSPEVRKTEFSNTLKEMENSLLSLQNTLSKDSFLFLIGEKLLKKALTPEIAPSKAQFFHGGIDHHPTPTAYRSLSISIAEQMRHLSRRAKTQ